MTIVAPLRRRVRRFRDRRSAPSSTGEFRARAQRAGCWSPCCTSRTAATRLVADDAFGAGRRPRRRRSSTSRDCSASTGRSALNALFVEVDWLGLLGSYWYASAHYVVTAVVLVSALPPRPDDVRPRPPGAPDRHRGGAGAVPPAADGAAAAHRWVRRRAEPALGRRVVGCRRLRPARARRLHQPAGGVPVAARGVGAVGGAGGPQRHAEPPRPCLRLGARGGDRGGHRRHRQPLGAGRGRRLAARGGRLAGPEASRATTRHIAPRLGVRRASTASNQGLSGTTAGLPRRCRTCASGP